MRRFTFALQRPGYVDAASAETALKVAIETKILTFKESEIPKKAIIECLVTDKPNPNGQYTATSYFNGELLASCDAPSPERALLALGMDSPLAHTCRVYKQRFGSNYELVMRASRTEKAAS